MKQQQKRKTQQGMETIAKKSLEKLPPYDLDAEQAILGAILVDNFAINIVLELMNPEEFYRGSHTKVLLAMLALQDNGDAVDLLTLRDELSRRDELDDVGGSAYLAVISDTVFTGVNVEYHANIVHETFVARQTLTTSIETASECYEYGYTGSELRDRAITRLDAIGERNKQGFVPIAEILPAVAEEVDKIAENGSDLTGLPSGFADLDFLTKGFQASDLVMIAGRPSMGKTSLSTQVALHLAIKFNIPIAYFSIETSKEKIAERLQGQLAKVDLRNILRWTDEDWGKWTHAGDELHNAPIFIDDSNPINHIELRAKARRLHHQHPIGCLVVDYSQLVTCALKQETRQLDVAEISRSLKSLAKTLHIPVLALAQLSRKPESRSDGRPQLADLKESGQFEQDADVVIFIYRPEVYGIEGAEGLAEIIIGKQRNGPVGSVQLAFVKEHTRFETLETRHVAPDAPEQEEVF